MTLKDVIIICVRSQSGQITLAYKVEGQMIQRGPYTENQFMCAMQQEDIISQLQTITDVCLKISCDEGTKKIQIKKYPDWMDVTFPMGKKEITQIHNDYFDYFISADDKEITIRIKPEMPSRILKQISLKSQKMSYEPDEH